MTRHECVAGLFKQYSESAKASGNNEIEQMVRNFESNFKPKRKKRGGEYDTAQWRMYKRAWRIEAHHRGLGT